MSSNVTGNPASGAWSPAITITEPADLDLLNAASVNTPFTTLANFIAFLQANAGQKNGANTWSAAQTMQALLSLTNNLAFSAAVAQTLLKTAAGGLTVGTAAGGGDLTLSANGVALLKLLATGSLDAQGKVLGNLAAPAAAGDALRKETLAWSAITPAANWTAGAGNYAPGYWKDPAGIVHLKGWFIAGASATTVMTGVGALPAGCRPATDRQFVGLDATTRLPLGIIIDQNGQITGPWGTPIVTADHYALDGISFVAEV